MGSRQIILTLTSIPPRFSNLPRRFRAIEAQTRRPDRVELNIPNAYRRFPGEVPALPALPDWVEIKRGETDYGPATKLLAAVERWRGQEADLLVCDDDRLQDKRWIERLAETRRLRPDDIIAERGWNIDERFGIEKSAPELPRAKLAPRGGRTPGYRLKRLASATLCHPPRQLYAAPGYVDVFEGFLGALVPPEAIPDAAFEIPEVIWTVDDVWLSGMAQAHGTGVWVHALPRPVFSDGPADRVASLRDFVEAGQGRQDADRLAVDYLREHHGAWR